MSNKFPMVSLDKIEVKLTMKVETVVAVDKVADIDREHTQPVA